MAPKQKQPQQPQKQQQQQVQVQLKELGSKLEAPPPSKDALLKLLKQAVTILSEVDQSPPTPILDSMQPFLKAIVKPELLKHNDKDVKLLVAACLCEVTRITAPEAPYSDDILKDVFVLIVSSLAGLNDTTGPSFGRRVIILETLARYRSCVVMLDLECDDLVSELFRTFLTVARDDHSENVLKSMRTIMIVLLDESEDIQEELLHILLNTLGRDKKDVTEAGRKLAMNVIECCSSKLEPAVKQFIISSMTGDSSMNYKVDYHEVIYDLYRCSPQILSGVVPYLTGELLNDQPEARLRAVKLVGELFALSSSAISEAFQSIFVEFLKRLADRELEVRLSVLDFVKKCLIADPVRPEAAQIFAALCDRLMDYSEDVRKQVVGVVCDVACHNLISVPVNILKLVAERLRDKSLLVKKYTMDRLAEVYRIYCLRCKEGFANEYDWIPGKILRCFYDKDFRSDAIESILCRQLFPAEFSVKEIVEHWIRILAGLDKVEVKALEKILEQKQRLQLEMLKYLSLKQTYKDTDAADYQKKVTLLSRIMSRFFTDPPKAEDGFLALDQLKDANIWKILTTFLDPDCSFSEACTSQDDLLNILGEKHRLFDFLNVLSVKCSYMLFNKEHVKEVLSELVLQKSSGNSESSLSCVNMLVIMASYCPLLFSGREEDLLNLLKDDNEIVKEGILHVLARAGGTIREQLTSSSSSVDLILETLCVEGTRRQAKYAVHALAAITKDDGLRSLSVLCKRLVDMMEEKGHLPTILQSLGCIAQTAMAVFETRESEIVEFIKSKILQCSNNGRDKPKTRWRDQSELCQLKIFGIKTLVKSYLPFKDAHLRGGIDSLLEILRNMLSFREFSKELESSSVDMAHLKLAAAKAILRLSRYWESKIPVDVFHQALRIVEINYRQVRKIFLSKVHQYIKDRVLDAKYACAFLLDIFVGKHAEVEEDKHYLGDVIQMCRQMKARQLSMQPDANSPFPYPEYILPYVVHLLAHHPTCPDFDNCRDVKAFETIYRVLYLFLSMVIHGEEESEANTADKGNDTVLSVISILQWIKQSEDVVQPTKSKNSHGISEVGMLVMKRLTQKSDDWEGVTESVCLPSMLYKPIESNEEDTTKESEVRKWLADDSVVAHFQSLTVDADGSVHLEAPQDDVLEDIETEGKELPLGKLIKKLKSQKNKLKIIEKDNSSVTEMKNNADVLKVVRELNLDNLGFSSKVDPSNGHDDRLTNKTNNGIENHSKKRKDTDAESTPIPKRKRSLAARSPSKYAPSRSISKASAETSSKSSAATKVNSESKESVSPAKRKQTSKASKLDNDEEAPRVEKSKVRSRKNPKLVESVEIKSVDIENSPVESIKRQKRSFGGLSKCTATEAGNTTDLVDCRIKVWWPMDQLFYEGLVTSYDPQKKKHAILYEDGDVEVLRLDKERWEMVDDNRRPKKSQKMSLAKSPSNIVSPKKKSMLSGGSGKRKEDKRSSSAKGKIAQKKTLKVQRKATTGRKKTSTAEVEDRLDISDVEPTVSEVDELGSGNQKQDLLHDMPDSVGCSTEKTAGTAGRGDTDVGGSDSESEKEVNLSSEHEEGKDLDGNVLNSRGSDVDISNGIGKDVETPSGFLHECTKENPGDQADSRPTPSKDDTSDAEDAEDKPLRTWMRVKSQHSSR